MRLPVILVLLTLGGSPAAMPPKEFSGRITYAMRFIDPRTGTELTTLFGHPVDRKQVYEIDGRNYRSYNEHGRLVQLYRSAENAYYFFQDDQVTKFDAAKEIPRVLAVRPSRKVARVLGRSCLGVELETSAGTETHFFDPSGPRVDPAAFARHAFGGWNRFLQASKGALDLKIITRNKDFVLTMEAIDVSDAKFRPEDFDVATSLHTGKEEPRSPVSP